MAKMFLCIIFFVFLSQGWGDVHTPKMKTFGSFNVENEVAFQLYTRQNLHSGIKLTVGNKTELLSSGFKASVPTIICAHGYFDSENTYWIARIKQGYSGILKVKEVNFITVDYSSVSYNLLYDELVSFIKQAGLYTGQLLKFLESDGKLNIEKVHLIGHSLGAHLIAFTAKAFPVKKTIGRITGLDPAGPLFENAPESQRLNPDSAKIVDVIHTCKFFVGMKKPIGTIDFYPNGGYNQRGCSEFDLRCHHSSSHEYFYETISNINRDQYIAKKCDNLKNAFNGSCYGESSTMGYYLNYRFEELNRINCLGIAPDFFSALQRMASLLPDYYEPLTTGCSKIQVLCASRLMLLNPATLNRKVGEKKEED